MLPAPSSLLPYRWQDWGYLPSVSPDPAAGQRRSRGLAPMVSMVAVPDDRADNTDT